MDFGKSKLNFEEVDHRYAQLKRQVDAGQITQEEFDEQLKRSMVQDDSGRWWAKSRKSGEWYYHDGRTWMRGTLPGYAPPTLEQPPTEQRRDTLMERPSTYEDRHPTGHNQNEGEQRTRELSSSLGRIVVLSLVAVVCVLGIGGGGIVKCCGSVPITRRPSAPRFFRPTLRLRTWLRPSPKGPAGSRLASSTSLLEPPTA